MESRFLWTYHQIWMGSWPLLFAWITGSNNLNSSSWRLEGHLDGPCTLGLCQAKVSKNWHRSRLGHAPQPKQLSYYSLAVILQWRFLSRGFLSHQETADGEYWDTVQPHTKSSDASEGFPQRDFNKFTGTDSGADECMMDWGLALQLGLQSEHVTSPIEAKALNGFDLFTTSYRN